MSRTRGHGTGHKWHGRKSPGYDYWSRRPGPTIPGKRNRRITHHMERQRERQELRELEP